MIPSIHGKAAVLAACLGLAGAAGAQTAASAPANADNMMHKAPGTLSNSDRKFVEEAAIGGMAEVEMGNLAGQKAGSDAVKQFGQRMATDHSKANDELKQVASTKGVQVPASLDHKHQRELDKLSKKSGADFDKAYMSLMVDDHKKDVAEFRKEAGSAKDPDVKSFASKTLPTLQEHLQLAQTTNDEVKKSK
jgi:putative membrane protein